jgi:hypothetical protein
MAYTPEQIQQAMRAAMQAGDAEAVADLRQRLTEAYQSEVPRATEGMSGLERFTAGVGQGATNVGRQIKSLAGMRSPEEAAEQRRIDADLLSTGAGKAGALTGEVLATAPVGGLVGAAGKQAAARLGAGTLGRGLATVAGGGVGQGAAEGALMSEGDRLRGAAAGAAGGALIPWAGGKALRALNRGVAPTPAARRLMAQGVDLTPGQMNPSSSIGQIEEAATNAPFLGPAIQRARAASQQDWQRAAIRQGAAPGARRPGTVDEAYSSFGPAYDQAKGIPTYPKIVAGGAVGSGAPVAGADIPLASFPQVRGAFASAVRDPNVMADPAKRKQVNAWLQNKLAQLPDAGRNTGATMDSEHLLKLRSDIRDQMRSAGKGAQPDDAQVALLKNAEQAITQALESQFPRQASDALRTTDRAYSQYKIVEDAARRAGDQPQGFTPSQLSASVRAATPNSAYARGAGGPLRKLASSGKEVFDARTPPTGARLATLGGLGWLIGAPAAATVAGVTAAAAMTKGGRRLMAGGTKAQQKSLAVQRALRRKAKRVIDPLATAAGARYAEEKTDQEY